jgi:AraC-like DNA-binding protein/mannose-6-phosphate isomerase-like protein (cupin superfamily)
MSEENESRQELALDQARIVRLSSGFGTRVEVLQARYQSQSFARHTHDTYTLGMVVGGVGTFWCRGGEQVAAKGDIVAIPPGEVHTGNVRSAADPLRYLAIYLPVDLAVLHLQSAGLRGSNPPEFDAVVLRDAEVSHAFTKLNSTISASTIDELASEEAACLAVTQLIRRHAEHHTSNDKSVDTKVAESRVAGIVREAIGDCYANPRATSLQVLAARAGVTPFRVIRAFRKSTGLAPHQFLIQVRVARARQLLAEGAEPSMTALMTGFADQSHLTYHFKKHLGITPANYQRCVKPR